MSYFSQSFEMIVAETLRIFQRIETGRCESKQ